MIMNPVNVLLCRHDALRPCLFSYFQCVLLIGNQETACLNELWSEGGSSRPLELPNVERCCTLNRDVSLKKDGIHCNNL